MPSKECITDMDELLLRFVLYDIDLDESRISLTLYSSKRRIALPIANSNTVKYLI